MSEITIPFGEIGILEVINHGSRTPRKMLTFGNWAPGGVRSQKLLHSFPANTPFAYQVPEGELGEYAPMAVFYTVVPHECTQRFWDERKKDFSRSFSAKVHAFKRQYEGMMLSDMVRKGILLGREPKRLKAVTGAWSFSESARRSAWRRIRSISNNLLSHQEKPHLKVLPILTDWVQSKKIGSACAAF